MNELILVGLRHEIVMWLCLEMSWLSGLQLIITDVITWAMLALQDSAPHQVLGTPLQLCEIWPFLTKLLRHQL